LEVHEARLLDRATAAQTIAELERAALLFTDPPEETHNDQRGDREAFGSERGREHTAMLEAALARPGVREVMDVYRGWQEKDRGLDAYRSAAKAPDRVTNSNSSRSL